MYTIPLLYLSFLAYGATTASNSDFRTRCLNFKPDFPHAKIELIEYLAQGTSAALIYRHQTCGGPGSSANVEQDVCRVALRIDTSGRSGIQFEAWFPKVFSGRFLGTGNGGLNGCLDYASLVYGTAQGFATVAANNGHNGTSGVEFFQNADVIHDFADRSIHTSVLAGKALTKKFYGSQHSKSYFLGCSQGGRQGIASAEKFPNDFDGVVAGAPALDFNSMVSWRASFFPLTGAASSPDFITAEMWSGLIHNEIMKQCDTLDGVRDGIIEYPDLCHFRPETLLCKSSSPPPCLTPTQISIFNRIFSPLKHPDGTLIFPALQPGAEQRAIDRLLSGSPFSDSRDWFRYVVRSNPSWDPATFTTEDARLAQQLDPFSIRTWPSHQALAPFTQKGGRILTYHGMQDQQITSHNTARWVEYLLSQTSSQDLAVWLRYFRISGMYHCNSGPGAWLIGQSASSLPFEARGNVLAALVRWVEEGEAPEEIEGSHLSAVKSGEVAFTRRHCAYPKRNHYRFQQSPANPDEEVPTSSTEEEWTCV